MESSQSKLLVELFHLLFMEQLSQRLDKRLYALKGGCNLRFFFENIRYSEDIDIDVNTISTETLKKNVNKILTGTSFTHILKTKNIIISDFTTPKQTLTTQGWKIQLKMINQSLPIQTKIEFSRRNEITNAIPEVISRSLMINYKMRPIFINHYSAQMALDQKIKALIQRTETQARDIFDIYHLIHTQSIKSDQLFFTEKDQQQAIHNAMSMGFSEFKSQVLSYLEPEYKTQYDDERMWNSILVAVCEYIEKPLS